MAFPVLRDGSQLKFLMKLFEKLKSGIKKTKETIFKNIETIFNSSCKIDDEFFNKLEEALIISDVGINVSEKICEKLKKEAKKLKIDNTLELKSEFVKIISEMLVTNHSQIKQNTEIISMAYPKRVILVVGVNGVGKTTTVGKLAHKFKKEGKSVIIAAADTFRDAAVAQLDILAKKADVLIVKNESTTDPSAVIYDALKTAESQKIDILLCDTAGRLHNKNNLMAQLEKIERITNKFCTKLKTEILLVLDATIGQNAIMQAKEFKNFVNVSGIILTKLDGTAKGGAIISVEEELHIPIEYVGLGEKISDLEEFDSQKFAQALFDFDNEANFIFKDTKN